MFGSFGVNRVSRPRFSDEIRRVNYASERFYQRCLGGPDLRSDAQSIHSGHRNELCEPTRQSRYAMLAIEGTLMRIVSATVFAEHLATAADTIQSLIDDDAIVGLQIADLGACLFDHARYFVSEYLWL